MLKTYAGDKLIRPFSRLINCPRLTERRWIGAPLQVRYGVLDQNLNGNVNTGEKRVLF